MKSVSFFPHSRTAMLGRKMCLSCAAIILATFASPIAAQDPAAPERDARSSAQADDWDVFLLKGKKIGHGHTRREQIKEDGRELLRISADIKLSFSRLGQTVQMNMHFSSVETLDGEVVRCRSKVHFGPSPTVTVGRVIGNKMQLEITTRGRTSKVELPWSKEHGGFFVEELSLERRPMKPGERRQLKGLVPGFNQVATVDLVAEDYDETEMLDGSKRRLLKVIGTTRLGLVKIKTISWTDEKGQTLKSFDTLQGQEIYSTTRKEALKDTAGELPDLLTGTLVELQDKQQLQQDASQMRFRLRLKQGNPAELFPNSVAQKIKPLGPREAELTVRDVTKIGEEIGDQADKTRPTKADIEPNNWIQSDDPRIIQMAGKVAADEKDPRKIAVGLEKYVSGAITEKDFSTALATAAEVAENLQGDCTEHAVLLCALARARRIPARVAVGLVYVRPLRGFGYHMWNEVWLGDQWFPLDATRPRGGTGIGHIKLAHGNFDSKNAAAAFLPVVQVMGQLEIAVLADEDAKEDAATGPDGKR